MRRLRLARTRIQDGFWPHYVAVSSSPIFREFCPDADVTDVKMLDLVLWQTRPQLFSADAAGERDPSGKKGAHVYLGNLLKSARSG